MTMRRILMALGVLVLVSLACNALEPTALPSPRPPPTAPPTKFIPPTFTPEPLDTGWQAVSDGIEVRRLRVQVAESSDRLWLVRVHPDRAGFRVVYDPANARTVRDWFDALDPRLVVNAGYFTPEKTATALVISDGVQSGQSYVGFGGMFALSGGRVVVRSLAAQPYSPDEVLDQAVQAFPMLIQPGGRQAAIEEDGRLARRTVVGQDRMRRIIFLISSTPIFSLKALAEFLAASDLDLDAALNLDGGTSSGVWFADQAGNAAGADSWVQVPAVIVVE